MVVQNKEISGPSLHAYQGYISTYLTRRDTHSSGQREGSFRDIMQGPATMQQKQDTGSRWDFRVPPSSPMQQPMQG